MVRSCSGMLRGMKAGLVLLTTTIPGMAVLALLLLGAFAVHWVLGLLLAPVLLLAIFGTLGEWLDAKFNSAQASPRSTEAQRRRGLGYPE